MPLVSRSDRLAFCTLVVMAAIGLVAAFLGQMPWWPGIFFAVGAAALMLESDLPRRIDEIELSDEGIRRTHGPRLWMKKVEAISWDDLSRVEMVPDSASSESVSFLLHGRSGPPIEVSDDRLEAEWLLVDMQSRLPGFDERQVDNAYEVCRAKGGRVLIWQRPASGPAN